MSVQLRQRPYSQNGYPFANFHYFTNEDIDDECDFETPMRTAEFVLIILLEGTIKCKINLQNIEMQKNCVVLISPNAVSRMISKSKSCKFVGLSFKSSFLVQIGIVKHKQDIFKILTNIRVPIMQLSDDEVEFQMSYMRNIQRMYKDVNGHLYAEEVIHTNFLSILYEMRYISHKHGEVLPKKISRKEAIVIKFGSLAMKHFKERKQLEFYASQIFITPKYLTETVKELTGQTAGEILDEMTIREAKLLLEDPNVSISEAAITLNFSDQSFFGKYFKRHTGYSPRGYRTQALI